MRLFLRDSFCVVVHAALNQLFAILSLEGIDLAPLSPLGGSL